MTVTFLDCTLRDGGYYTNWMFDRGVVERYLAAMNAAGVGVVEMGFRSIPDGSFLGTYGHTSDTHLRSLPLPGGIDIAVMVNVSEIVNDPRGVKASLHSLFAPAGESPVDIVRFAGHVRDAARVPEMAAVLNDLGYRVMVNLMQVSRYRPAQITEAGKAVVSEGGIETLYFADSFGDMDGDDIKRAANAVRHAFDGPTGLHAHDNRRLGVSNALAAVDEGVTWIDGTIRGMGRGAGNAQTEFLLPELAARQALSVSIDPLITTVMEDFGELQRTHGWGPDLLYRMAADATVHPTYVQMMRADGRYGLDDVVTAIHSLGASEGHAFSESRLSGALADDGSHADGSWDATGWLEGRDVLLIGAGPSVAEHREGIQSLIDTTEPAVLVLNTLPPIDPASVTAYVACHPARLLLEADRLLNLSAPLIAPATMLPAAAREATILDYGVHTTEGTFTIGERSAGVPARLAFAYAIAIATQAGARRILLSGMDGYTSGDPRHDEMVEVLEAYAEIEGALPIISLTPTTYPVEQASVYAAEV